MNIRNSMKVIKKPWGKEIWFIYTKHYVGKFLIIKKGHRLSKQYHRKKHESIYTLEGKYIMEINNRQKVMKQDSVIIVPPKTIHRMHAKFCDVKLLEISTPQVDDVVRLEDDYKRV